MRALNGRRSAGSAASAKKLRPYVEQVRAEAVRDFDARYPDLRFAPVVVVIAAYDEEGAIGGVLDGMPRAACGTTLDTLVVDDGSGDATTERAAASGAYVATLRRNCGHGIALRLGYELAREHGAD